MKRIIHLTTGVAAIGCVTIWAATARAADPAPTPAPVAPINDAPAFQPITVGLEAGTTGPGGRADWRFMDHLGVGTAFDYLSATYDGTIEGNNYHAHLRLMSEPLTLDLYPWKNHSFRISAGILFNENRLSGNANTGPGGLTLGNNTYTGSAALVVKQQVADPYISIGGKLYFDRAHHWSLGGELGVFYTGDPRVSLTANTTAPLVPGDLQSAQDKIKSYANDAKFWPVLKLSVNYSF